MKFSRKKSFTSGTKEARLRWHCQLPQQSGCLFLSNPTKIVIETHIVQKSSKLLAHATSLASTMTDRITFLAISLSSSTPSPEILADIPLG
jgi:hypothetical protein